MAERRMFAKSIIDSDLFLEMPVSARLLYYDLGMRADDDGFVNSPKKIMKIIGSTSDDMNILVHRNFIIPFDTGIVVIRHWRIHNYIRKDTYNETKHLDEKSELSFDKTNAYISPHDNKPRGRPVDEPSTQVRLGKDSIESIYNIYNIHSIARSDKIASEPEAIPVISLPLNTGDQHPITQNDIDRYAQLYPAVDILQALRSMAGWLDANPTKRKTPRGVKRFINSWLAREQDKGGTRGYAPSEPGPKANVLID